MLWCCEALMMPTGQHTDNNLSITFSLDFHFGSIYAYLNLQMKTGFDVFIVNGKFQLNHLI